MEARVTAELSANLSYGYCDAYFKSFPNATMNGANYTGYQLPDAAKTRWLEPWTTLIR